MSCRSHLLAVTFSLVVLGFVLFFVDLPELAGQAPAPPAIPKTYPTLTTPLNLVVKPGQTLDLLLTGTNLGGATAVWTSIPGAVTTMAPGQKDSVKLPVKLTLPANTPPGLHSIRVATPSGVSNLRPLLVEELPSTNEAAGKNKSAATAQSLTLPITVTGVADPDSSDFFKFPVVAGKPLTIEVLARRLGSPLDPVILLRNSQGKELGGVYADDTPGLQGDCRLVYTPSQSGELIVELRDCIYRGGSDYAYCLRIGDFPGATTAYPLALQRGQKGTIGFTGPDSSSAKPVSVTAPTEPTVPEITVIPRGSSGIAGWPVPVRLSDWPEAIEVEPNNDLGRATPLPVPGGVSAIFAEKGDVDTFKFPGKKGEKLIIQVLTHEVNAPTEVYLRILDEKGNDLAKSNPTAAEIKLEFTPPADGTYFVACEHLNYLFGPTEVYHLSIQPAKPDFRLTLGLDRFDLPPGGIGLIPLTGLTKLNGFNAPIAVSVRGAEGLTAELTLPAAANPQPNAPIWIPVRADAKQAPGVVTLAIVGQAVVDGQPVLRVADNRDALKAAMANLPNPPSSMAIQVAAAVVPAPPFDLTVSLVSPEVPVGGSIKGRIEAKREGEFAEEIQLLAVTQPPNVTVKLNPIAKGQTSAEFEIVADAKAAVGESLLLLRGNTKVAGSDVSRVVTPVLLKVVTGQPASPAAKTTPEKKK